MDLGTMSKKLKSQEYNSKQQFIDDLNLILSNCFTYNTAEDSIYRQHIQMLRDKWTYLLKNVPDIIIGKSIPVPESVGVPNVQVTNLTNVQVISIPAENSTKRSPTKNVAVANDPLDDLDDLLNAHLESLSDTESCPSPKKQKKTTTVVSPSSYEQVIEPKFKHFNELSDIFPRRCDKLMIKYASECKNAWGIGKRLNSVDSTDKNDSSVFNSNPDSTTSSSSSSSSSSPFVFPELVYFFNTVPDTRLIKSSPSICIPSYSPTNSMNRFHDNFRLLQSTRELRKHMLEGCRADPPNQQHLQTPSEYFNRFDEVLKGTVVENSWQAKCILRKVITLYLAQSGFERNLQTILLQPYLI